MSKSATSTPMQQPLGSPSLSDVGPMIDPALILAGLPTNARDFSSQVPRMHAFSDPSSHPSPSDSMNDLGSPGISPDDGQAFRNQMLPPFQTDMFAKSMSTAFRGNKRVRHSSASDVLARSSTPEHSFGRSHHNSIPSTSTPYFGDSKIGSQAPSFFDSYSTTPRFPLTPSASSVNSEDIYPGPLSKPSPAVTFNPNDPRRLSVNSLLIQEENNARTRAAISPMEKEDPMSQVVPYGIDRGSVDLDTPINDDAHVLDVITPVIPNANFANDGEISTEFGFGLFANSNEKVACYTDPVTVKISRSLLPLPDLLQNHPMNLMYFHFFQEFTAKILVPHDCPANPFKIILPQSIAHPCHLICSAC